MGHWDRTRQDGPLTVKIGQHDDTLIVRAIGELSRPTAEIFEAELRMAISGDAVTVELDLGAVGFIDSTGVRSVLRVANYSLRAGGRLRSAVYRRRSNRRSSGAAWSACCLPSTEASAELPSSGL